VVTESGCYQFRECAVWRGQFLAPKNKVTLIWLESLPGFLSSCPPSFL
jgi:hypothetical protein